MADRRVLSPSPTAQLSLIGRPPLGCHPEPGAARCQAASPWHLPVWHRLWTLGFPSKAVTSLCTLNSWWVGRRFRGPGRARLQERRQFEAGTLRRGISAENAPRCSSPASERESPPSGAGEEAPRHTKKFQESWLSSWQFKKTQTNPNQTKQTKKKP